MELVAKSMKLSVTEADTLLGAPKDRSFAGPTTAAALNCVTAVNLRRRAEANEVERVERDTRIELV